MVTDVTGRVPEPRATEGDERALEYMALEAGTPMQEIKLDRVFIGSCTNSRIGDLREAAEVIKGRKVADASARWWCPARTGEGAGRGRGPRRGVPRRRLRLALGAGCSMCLGMNPDIAAPGERVASTSNRNFEGRQGRGARSHL